MLGKHNDEKMATNSDRLKGMVVVTIDLNGLHLIKNKRMIGEN